VVQEHISRSATRVRVVAGDTADEFDTLPGYRLPAGPRHQLDDAQHVERDDDQITLSLEAVDDRDGHLALQVVKDVQAGLVEEFGKNHVVTFRGLRCGAATGRTGAR
jgi:hypothetical protein